MENLGKNGGKTLFIIFSIFLIGLAFKFTVFIDPHVEGDELIYMTLVDQMVSLQGYTLQGTHLLDKILDKKQYDRKLFFHPPGGILLFSMFYMVFGYKGFALAQVFCFIVFFWSMILILKSIEYPVSNIVYIVVACLAAFNPITSHVLTNFWLDGPLLAFSSLSIAMLLFSFRKRSRSLAMTAGIVLGFAGLIKSTAFLVIPGLALLVWATKWKDGNVIIYMGLYVVSAFIMQLPWFLVQWMTYGSMFPGPASLEWPGKPSDTLIRNNRYVYYVTVVRTPLLYLKMLPTVIYTLIPGIVLAVLNLHERKLRRINIALVVWIGMIVFLHVILGKMGYSKLMRYLILITPATILLFSLNIAEILKKLQSGNLGRYGTALTVFLILISAAAFYMEINEGARSSMMYNQDLITPRCRLFDS